MKEIIRTTKNMDGASSSGSQGTHTEGDTWMMNERASERCAGLMAPFTEAPGTRESSTDSASCSSPAETGGAASSCRMFSRKRPESLLSTMSGMNYTNRKTLKLQSLCRSHSEMKYWNTSRSKLVLDLQLIVQTDSTFHQVTMMMGSFHKIRNQSSQKITLSTLHSSKQNLRTRMISRPSRNRTGASTRANRGRAPHMTTSGTKALLTKNSRNKRPGLYMLLPDSLSTTVSMLTSGISTITRRRG